MSADPREVVFEMAQGRMLCFADAVQHQVFCLAGSLGLTRDGGDRPTVLLEGDSYQCDGGSVVMLQALSDARVRLLTPVAVFQPPPPVGRVSALGALLARLRR